MIKLTEIAPPKSTTEDVLTLDFDTRQKSRFSAKTDSGKEVGLFLERGQILRSGLILTGSEGINILIQAEPESVSVMRSDDSLQFAKACYHLGNRHVALQISQGELLFLTDHVLDHMLEGLGLTITHELLPFEPEAGAYHEH